MAAEGDDPALAAFRKQVQDFVAMWNGPWWTEGQFIHYCAGASCCARDSSGSSTSNTVAQLESTALGVPLRAMPTTPAANKWSKLGPCIDLLLVGLQCHQLLRSLWRSLNLGAESAVAGNNPEHERQYIEDLDFSAVQGKRWGTGMAALDDATFRFSISLLALVLEPLRTITAWLMRRAKESQSEFAMPRIFDFFLKDRSCTTYSEY